MTQIKLYGKLGKLFGAVHLLNLETLQEFGAAMECQAPGFKKYFISDEAVKCTVFVDGVLIENDQHLKSRMSLKPKTVEMVPVACGATYFIPALATYIGTYGVGQAVATAIASAIVLTAVSVVSAVVTTLFAPKPKSGLNASTANAGLNSYYFGGRQNKAQQGQSIPIVYGELLVGSYVIQAGIRNLDRQQFEDLTFGGTGTSGSGTTSVPGPAPSTISITSTNSTINSYGALGGLLLAGGPPYVWAFIGGGDLTVKVTAAGAGTILNKTTVIAQRAGTDLSPYGVYNSTVAGQIIYGSAGFTVTVAP